MHEFGIAYDIYATARKAALEKGAKDVKEVHVEFGEMAMVSPEQVSSSTKPSPRRIPHERLAPDLVYRPAPDKMQLRIRGSERFVCPQCGKFPELVKGGEVLVTHMEVEVDDE